MTDNFLLLKYWHMVLTVCIQFVTVCSTSGFFNEIFRHVEIFLVAGHLIKFCQSHLNYRMSGRNMFLIFTRTENFTNQIGILDCHIEQSSFTCCLIMSNSCFIQVSGVIQLMTVYFLPSFCSPPSGQACTFVGNTCCKISVRFLSCGNYSDNTIQITVQILVIFVCQRI